MIRRELYIKKIRPFISRDIIKVLSGIRRCGKSVMLELIKQELCDCGINSRQFLSVNFESKAVDYVKSVDKTYAVIKKFALESKDKIYLFLDEVQELEGWEKMVNSCIIDFDADIYITGSNAKLLSGELATYLGGRYVEFRIYPFSFAEVMDIVSAANENVKSSDLFHTYLIRGGMPFLYQFPMDNQSAMQYLNDVYDSIILKDITQRNRIRDVELLKRIIHFFVLNIGNTFSSANIIKFLKSERRNISTETIYNYIDYCKNACLLYLVPREDIIGKRILRFQEKVYMADHGIREAVYGRNMQDINQILENIVYMELLRRDYQVTVGRHGVKEIDFVAVHGADKIYVQVSYLLASDETVGREFSVLEAVPDNYPKFVVTMDEIDRSRNGIRHMNIRNFLLSNDF